MSAAVGGEGAVYKFMVDDYFIDESTIFIGIGSVLGASECCGKGRSIWIGFYRSRKSCNKIFGTNLIIEAFLYEEQTRRGTLRTLESESDSQAGLHSSAQHCTQSKGFSRHAGVSCNEGMWRMVTKNVEIRPDWAIFKDHSMSAVKDMGFYYTHIPTSGVFP